MKTIKITQLSMCSALATLALLVIAGTTASAQTVYGSIVGNVADATGSAVPDASVKLTNLGANESRTAQTDGGGNYTFVNLLPGNYGITVEKTGFKKLVRQPIEVQVNSAIRVDLPLEVGDNMQTVQVTAEAPLLQTQNATIGTEVEGRQVQDLALNGRNVLNLIELAPGVVPQGSMLNGGNAVTAGLTMLQYQMGGGQAGQSAAYIDGAPVNVSYENGAAYVPVQDAVQEFRIVTNDVGPEFGRFAGGVVNISTKSGTNTIHGTVYDYLRNQDLNANTFFNNKAGLPRAVYQQNEYGANLGGPVKKNKTFYFLSWEQIDLRQASTTSTTVPTVAMRTGDFSAAKIPAIFDPLTTALNAAGVEQRSPFPGNIIPANRLNPTALILENLLFPSPTNTALGTNYIVNVPKETDGNNYLARVDHQFSDKDQFFVRFSDLNKNYSASSALLQTGTGGKSAATQAVIGNTYTVTPTTIVDARAAFFRYFSFTNPLTVGMNMGVLGPAWAQYNTEMTIPELPNPDIVPDNNFNGTPTIFETDNSYSLSGNVTKILGRHTLRMGIEARRIEWYYYQSNSSGSTFTFDSGFTSEFPLAASSVTGSPANTGYGTASFLLGFPSAGSASEPDKSAGLMHYLGVYLNDSFRVSKKLSLQLGIRGESPGSFQERYNSLTTWDPTLSQTALASATGLPIQGGLVLDGSTERPNRSWQNSHFLPSPRVGLAYSFTDTFVIRTGYGIADLPAPVCFCLGPYNSPVNLSVTNMTTSLNGGLTPDLATTLSNPFPSGIVPPQHTQAFINSLIGQGVQSPLAQQPYPYVQSWNVDVQKQFGRGVVLDVGYMGSRGVHLPMYDINTDQLPDQYLSMGNALLNQVQNPFYGLIPASDGVLGQPTVAQGYLLKPYPQYLYTSVLAAAEGDSYYRSLQVKVQKKLGSGVLGAAYSWAHLHGDVDVLDPWAEQNRYDVGGGEGVQDNTNIKGGESSLSSFDVPQRFVFNYVLDLPFGEGHKYLNSLRGVPGKLVSGWSVNGITQFQTGFPLALQDTSPNLFETDFAIGNGGPGPPGAGVSRPDYTPGCNKAAPNTSSLQAHLAEWFNTSCFVQAGPWEIGNEPRVDPTMRAPGINNSDFSVSKATAITERARLLFRAEVFNIFNRVQFTAPGTQLGSATFGQITAQYNNPRLIQFGLRLTY
jgi:hypothetical protein